MILSLQNASIGQYTKPTSNPFTFFLICLPALNGKIKLCKTKDKILSYVSIAINLSNGKPFHIPKFSTCLEMIGTTRSPFSHKALDIRYASSAPPPFLPVKFTTVTFFPIDLYIWDILLSTDFVEK